jgi:hypothetical protein
VFVYILNGLFSIKVEIEQRAIYDENKCNQKHTHNNTLTHLHTIPYQSKHHFPNDRLYSFHSHYLKNKKCDSAILNITEVFHCYTI